MALSDIERYSGCLLGHAIGDAMGAPFEGLASDVIYHSFGSLHRVIAKPPVDALFYTDDTQMTIAVAEALISRGQIEEDALCAAFASHYQPGRGYGPGAQKILDAMVQGEDWREIARNVFPGGSLGNGAAMRVAPIGLIFRDDLDRVAEEARLSALPTHTHPIGIEAAQLLAIAVALVARGDHFDREAFFGELRKRATLEEFQWQLSVASKLTIDHSLSVLGNSLEAHRSVITAIACFAVEPESYTGVIGRAIGLGNDTDTIAAMAGALSGTHLGLAAVPAHLLELLEDGEKGRSYLLHLAGRLVDVSRRGS